MRSKTEPVGPAVPEPESGEEVPIAEYRGRDLDRLFELVMTAVPWVLLAVPAGISQLPAQPWTERALTLGLVALAAAWIYLLHTRVGVRRPQTLTRIYFAGFLALGAALLAQDVVFVVFVITGFFHAYQVRPWQLGVAGVLGTSVVMNVATVLPDGGIAPFVGVVTIQTVAIGAGIFFAEKANLHHRRREVLVNRLEAALAENAGLHAQLLTQAREAGMLDERQRMAREIHDTLAQGLTGIITQVQAVQQVWGSPEQARRHLDRALELARSSLAEARRSVQALRPQELDTAKLPDAVRQMARDWSENANLDLRFEVTGDSLPLSPALEVALFRVAQEALANVGKHAHATRVGVTLSYLGDAVLLDIRDDGVGMARERPGRVGFGINSMTQRIRGVGGRLEIESAPGEGTAVSASVPAIPVGEGT